MRTLTLRLVTVVTAVLLGMSGPACSRRNTLTEHLDQAEAYRAAGDYARAEVEYLNVLQLDPTNGTAVAGLGLIYFEQGRIPHAASFLAGAGQLQADNLEVRMKLGLTHLSLGNRVQARQEATTVLEAEPAHGEAPLLLAEASASAEEVADAQERIATLVSTQGETPPILVARATLALRTGEVTAAERDLEQALAQDPSFSNAHSVLGAIRVAQGRMDDAETALAAAARLAAPRAPQRLQFARFQIQRGDPAEGRRLLEEMTRETPDYLPAWVNLAQLAAAEGRLEESAELNAKVLARDQNYPDAILLEVRLQLARGEVDPAIDQLRRALGVFPSSPQFHYQLGVAHLAKNEPGPAADSLRQALSLAPGMTEASLLLASLEMRQGSPATAVSGLKAVLQRHPNLPEAWMLLADAQRAQNDFDSALATYAEYEQKFSPNTRTALLTGQILLQQNKPAEARAAFERALELDRDFAPAVEHLVNLDLAQNRADAARERVQAEIARKPDMAEWQILLARVLFAERRPADAEAALQKAIALRPDTPVPYALLAGYQVSAGRTEDALRNLREVVQRSPRDVRAWMTIAVLHEQRGEAEAAVAAYEKLLEVEPRSGLALNNLAYLYAEHFGEYEKAFAAAQKAREILPQNPSVADTLGWIALRRGQFSWALSLLRESADRMPDSAEVHYHLGVAHYLMGQEEPAREALQRAVDSSQAFTGRDDAVARLTLLAIDPVAIEEAQRDLIDRVLAERPDDPVARLRLGALQEQRNEPEQAARTYRRILDANGDNVAAMVRLILLELRQRNPTAALELARKARQLAPTAVPVAHVAGRAAYQAGDYAWAYSLLQEAARRQRQDAAILHDYAWAAYSTGRVSEAATAMQEALAADPDAEFGLAGRSMLHLIELAGDPVAAAAAATHTDETLASDPRNVPALMAAAAACEHRRDQSAAAGHYRRVLEIFPEFAPARRGLALYYAAHPADDRAALQLALQARESYPDDAELAKSLGILLYRTGDYARAVTLLQESAGRRPSDGEVPFYAGLAQFRLDQPEAARRSLEQALSLELSAEQAAEAQRLLAAP